MSTVFAAATSIGGVGCSQQSSPPKHDDGYYAGFANQRSWAAIVQFGIDSKQLDVATLPPQMVAGGVAVDGGDLASWFDDQKSRQLASGSTVTLDDAARHVAHAIQLTALAQTNEDRKRKAPPISVDAAARVAVVQALVDGNWITRGDLGAAADDTGQAVAGPAADAWFSAHADQPLVQGASVTVRAEVARFAAEFGKPPAS